MKNTPDKSLDKSLYRTEDIPENMLPHSAPGEYPFRRGIHREMYARRLWTMRQYAGYGTAKDTNLRYRYLLDKGQTGLSVAFDLPTQLGLDSDHPLAQGEVGRVGVAVSTLDDMTELLQGIPLGEISLSMTINATAPILLAMYVALAKRRGVPNDLLSGTVQNDILKEYVARGNYIFGVGPSVKLIADVMEYCSKELPKFNSISISGYHIREAGATAVQELAFTFANALAYVEAALERKLDIDSFAPRISFFFNSHRHFLEEIAKFRAARVIWAKLMKDRFHAQNPRSWKLRFHTQTGGSTLTRQQPLNNVVRVTLQALAAVLGGTQSLHTNSFDEAVGLPTEEAVTLALRTQQILALESGIADTADPFGGAYVIESLTSEIEGKVWDELETIAQKGGAPACIEQGYFQKEIEESAYLWQMGVEQKTLKVVGVNTLMETGGPEPHSLRLDPTIETQRKKMLARYRTRQKQADAGSLLDRLKLLASTTENIMPHLVECVDQGLTLGQITAVLKDVYGVYQAP